MTDKQLIQLAAKAAGLKIDWDVVLDCDDYSQYRITGTHDYWNPLFDDGDALRLAVATGVLQGRGFDDAWTALYAVNKLPRDRFEAYRRAITQAAANLTGKLP